MEEVLRFHHVTYEEKGELLLDDFHLNLYRGEIMGLIAGRGRSTEGLLKILERNLPLQEGYVYLREKMVNSWKESSDTHNKIIIIQRTSSLVEGMKVYENIFVLRSGFSRMIINKRQLKNQLLPIFEEINVHIDPENYGDRLSYFERIIVEMVRGIIWGAPCIVMVKVDALLSGRERKKLFQVMEHYRKKGKSFLYISSYTQEIPYFCKRFAVLSDGKVQMIWSKESHGFSQNLSEIKEEERETGEKYGQEMDLHLHLRETHKDNIKNFQLKVKEGECVVWQSVDYFTFISLVCLLTTEKILSPQEVWFMGKKIDVIKESHIMVIPEGAAQGMIFEDLSVCDNLLIGVSNIIMEIHNKNKICQSIIGEGLITGEILSKKTKDLSFQERIQLVYGRAIMLKPSLLILIQPFSGINYTERQFVSECIRKIKKRGIGVIILTINLSDTLHVGERFIKTDKYGTMVEMSKEEFLLISKG